MGHPTAETGTARRRVLPSLSTADRQGRVSVA